MIEINELDELFDASQSQISSSVMPIIGDIDPNEDFTLSSDELGATMPILPLRNMVLFPGQIMPVLVGREKSRNLIRWAESSKALFAAVTQRDADVEDPTISDLYEVGVVATLEQVLEMPDGSLTAIIRGSQRVRIGAEHSLIPHLSAEVSLLTEIVPRRNNPEFKVLAASIKENYLTQFKLIHNAMPKQMQESFQRNKNGIYLINNSIGLLSINIQAKQALLELDDIRDRGLKVLGFQQSELQMLRLKASLTNKTQREMDRQQKEYFLQQQIRTFQEELGGSTHDLEIAELREQASKMLWTEAVGEIFEKEVRKAERLNPQSPDYAVQVQYLRTIVSLPWGVYSQDNFDLKNAQKKLDEEHFGLEKVKERILEHLAVLKLKGDMKSPIICLYGPPGVGKTSLGRSIADSLGRKYVRISLGGVHDEAEIRGHRRTYIGAMSGRIIQSLQKAGTSNPVFVLDEIDKLSGDYKGDPAAALLEVLDPEQNSTFHDNYLDIDYDLSKVLFIATANNIGAISQPLRDRMELIEVSGYIAEEKMQIAKRHLIPKIAQEHGLAGRNIRFTPKAIETIIDQYTRESGVRALSKKIAAIMRKIAWQEASSSSVGAKTEVTPALVKEYLGKPIFSRDKYQGNEHPGVVVGLAWTSVGGEILFIESSLHRGQEFKLSLTGSLGDVMKESAVLALDYIRAHRDELGIEDAAIKDKEVHIHVPEGAVPKDGPSAGITIVTSLVSTMTGRLVRPHIAMTGEITLRGKVLPVGGIKEKILAAKRSGIKEIILCKENEKDIAEIKELYVRGLQFHYVEEISQVLDLALEKAPAKAK